MGKFITRVTSHIRIMSKICIRYRYKAKRCVPPSPCAWARSGRERERERKRGSQKRPKVEKAHAQIGKGSLQGPAFFYQRKLDAPFKERHEQVPLHARPEQKMRTCKNRLPWVVDHLISPRLIHFIYPLIPFRSAWGRASFSSSS